MGGQSSRALRKRLVGLQQHMVLLLLLVVLQLEPSTALRQGSNHSLLPLSFSFFKGNLLVTVQRAKGCSIGAWVSREQPPHCIHLTSRTQSAGAWCTGNPVGHRLLICMNVLWRCPVSWSCSFLSQVCHKFRVIWFKAFPCLPCFQLELGDREIEGGNYAFVATSISYINFTNSPISPYLVSLFASHI